MSAKICVLLFTATFFANYAFGKRKSDDWIENGYTCESLESMAEKKEEAQIQNTDSPLMIDIEIKSIEPTKECCSSGNQECTVQSRDYRALKLP